LISPLEGMQSSDLKQALALDWLNSDPQSRIIIDDELNLVWANDAARELVGQGCELEVKDGFLQTRTKAVHDALVQFAIGCGRDIATFCLRCEDGKGHLLFRGREISRRSGQRWIGIIFFLSNGQNGTRYADLDQAFSLTPAEHRVLLHMIEGETADAVATRLGVSLETVRSHIRHLYGKLNVSSREELFARIQPFRI
jgi:DNA-binding CsgD family transcriptional regulator